MQYQKYFSIFFNYVILLFLCSSYLYPNIENTYSNILGDVNQDKKLHVVDVEIMLSAIFNNNHTLLNGDIVKDGILNISDLVILVNSILYPFQNYGYSHSLFNSVNKFLIQHRLHIDSEDLKVENGVISLVIDGRRTNVQSQLLIGFYSLAHSLKKQSFNCLQVEVILNCDTNRTKQILAKASIDSVRALANETIKPNHFLNSIHS